MREGIATLLLTSMAAAASPAAAYDSGQRAYARGQYVLSAELLLRDAQRGRALAQTYLGYQYQYGLGVPKSYEEAASWYICAAEQGEPSAQFFLGQLYDRGEGVPEDPVEAGKWLDLAAAHAPASKSAYWASMRDIISGKMTLDELSEARRRAVAWTPSYLCPAASEIEVLQLPTKKYSRREADGER